MAMHLHVAGIWVLVGLKSQMASLINSILLYYLLSLINWVLNLLGLVLAFFIKAHLAIFIYTFVIFFTSFTKNNFVVLFVNSLWACCHFHLRFVKSFDI